MKGLVLTRAGTMGPVADLVARSGGSVPRLFQAAGLPLRILDEPDLLILLRDQFLLVETASRMIGDGALPARLSTMSGLEGLGAYGRHLLTVDRLGTAIERAYRSCGRLLQASTAMELSATAGWARWTYAITADIRVGRQKNELLALGYMLQVLRCFAGPDWTPDRVELPGTLQDRQAIADVLRSDVTEGERAAVVFRAELLDAPNPREAIVVGEACVVPPAGDLIGVAEHLIGLDLASGRTGIDGLADRLRLSRRTLQRRLAEHGATFEALLQTTRRRRACAALRGAAPIAQIAYELGYSDPAHFTRAFRRWAGRTPLDWRRRPSA
ncbi:AraC family transcriptional regulator [Hansschlegelia plantiphila]|uniref:AraC family transcriptional regulator n=1 Tax=Hansschlegelia plantiphila TaxID=374655 RepID=UPI0022F24AF9|nr:AraC family transcriptional regulator [Hansschlegelia plantiphila]